MVILIFVFGQPKTVYLVVPGNFLHMAIRLLELLRPESPFIPWWRHQMETFSALLTICAGNVPGWRGALMFSLICFWITGWVNTREAGDLRRYRAHYDVTVMWKCIKMSTIFFRPLCLSESIAWFNVNMTFLPDWFVSIREKQIFKH